MKNKKYLLVILVMLILPFCGCEMLGLTEDGLLSFDDFTELDTGRLVSGITGTISFNETLVDPVERSIESLTMTNSGSGEMKIINAEVLGEGFGFIDGKKPDLPIKIPAGKTINDIFVEFIPRSAGLYEGMLQLETETKIYYFALEGTGVWQLTITLDAGDACKVTSPVAVDPGETKTITTSTGELELTCELDFMREFVQWDTTSIHTAENEPLFGGDEDDPSLKVDYTKTTVVIREHTTLNPDVLSPYYLVPDDYVSIQAAITACTVPTQKAVAVSNAYDAANDSTITMKAGISLKGGYNTTFTSRLYKTTGDRENAAYATTISLTGSINAGSAIGSDVVIEGFTINETGTSSAVLLDASKAGVYYNTINAGGQAAGVKVTNGSTSIISGNVITGGATTADYSETYGIMVTEESDPVIYNNIINGGTAGGKGSAAYAVFADFDNEVTALGNTVNGGSGSESYGFYMINNGKLRADYNSISGGSGTESYAVFTNYGGNLYLTHNNIFTSGGTTRYGVVSGFSGRLRNLSDNGIYNCSSGLISVYVSGSASVKTTINDVNDYCNTDTNKESIVSILKTDYVEAKYE